MRPDCRKRVGKILGRPMMAEEERAIDRRMRRAVKALKKTEPGWKDMTKMQRLDRVAAYAGDSFATELEEFRMDVPVKSAPLSEDVRQAERDRQQRMVDQGFTIQAVRGVRFVRREGNPLDGELTGGRWFTDQPRTSNTYTGEFGKDMATASMKVRLRLRNPLVIDAQGKRFDQIPRTSLPEAVQKEAVRGKMLSTDDIADAARIAEGGYDGVIFKNLKDDLTSNAITTKPATVYAVFDRKNIRSEFAQFDPALAEDAGLLYQSAANDQNNLFVAHNTSEEKLRKTLELGGMPMPSLAVARTDKGGFTGYGEITFLADPRILNEKDVTAYNADIYSPRVPQALPEYDEAEAAKFIKEAKPLIPEDAGVSPYLSLDEMTSDLPYELSHSDFVRAAYLAEQGRLPKLKKLKVPPAVRKAMDLEWMSDEWKALATEHFRKMEDEFNAARVEAGREPINLHFEDDGMLSRGSLNEFDNLIRKARKSQYDQDAFQREVYSRTVGTQAAREKFRKYTTALAERITKGKRMFAGFSYSGNRRFKAFNLENIMQEMRKEMRAGGRDAFGGEGSIRARVAASPMRTMRDVQKARNRIVSSEELDQIKEENNNRFFELTEQLQPFYKFSASGMEYMDAVADAIADGPRGWRESFDADAIPLIQEYVDHLRSLPTEYFEAKANRVMRVNDFAVAVVPRNISPDVKKALQDAGVQLRFYKKGDEADRLRAIRQQEDLLFQTVAPDTSTPEGRAEWVQTYTASDVIPGEPAGSMRYAFRMRDGLSPYLDVLSSAEGRPAEIVFDFMERDDTTGMFENMASLTTQERFFLAARLRAIVEQDIETMARDAYVFLPYDRGQRAVFLRGLRDIPDYEVFEHDGEVFLVHKDADIGADNKVLPSGRQRPDTQDRPGRVEEGSPEDWLASFSERVSSLPDEQAAGGRRGAVGSLFQDQKRASVQIPGVLQGAPGSAILSDRNVIVRLSNAADKTSFLHESAHIFLELYGALESQNEIIAQRMDAIRDVLKVKKGDPLTVQQHELFAEMFEAYMMEGKSPNAELRSVFQKFRAWFTEVYRRLRGQLPKLNQEARDIFDRMLATEEEIEAARSDYNIRLSSKMSGMMTPEQVEKYKDYAEKAGQVAQDKLFRKFMDQILKRQRVAYRADKERVEKEVRANLEKMGVYRARAEISDDGKTVREGIDPDMVAPDYGYSTGEALVKAMAKFPSLENAVKRETKRRMDELYGDMLTDGTAEAKAIEAVFNEPAVKMLEAERDALAEKAARNPIPLKAIRERAEAMINSTPINEIITPGKYAIKARDLHKRAIRAAAQGKWDDALRYTHQAMLQHELARRAYKAREEFETIRRVLKPYRRSRFPKKDTHKKMDPPFIKAIVDLMSLPGTDNQFDRMEGLRRFQEQQAAEGIAIALPGLVEANKPLPDMRTMTMDQSRDFRDSVRNIARQGRANSAEARAAFTQEVQDLAQIIRDNYTGETKRETRNPTIMEKAGSKVRALEALFLRYPFLVEALQGGKTGKIVEALEQGVRRQLTLRNERRREMGRQLVAILDKHGITQDELNKRIEAPAIESGPVKFEQVLALALNTGTQSNRDRLASDPSLGGIAQLEALLEEKLEKRHWDAVQDIWDLIGTLWPEAKEVEQRVSGITPKKVDAVQVDTKFGSYRGGYFPISYDRAFLSNRDLEQSDMKGLWKQSVNGMATNAATEKGFLQERVDGVTRPLNLGMDTILEHIDDVTNDIYMREETIRISRILRHPAFTEAMAETHGKEYQKTLETVVKRVVHGTERPGDDIERLFRTLRVNAAIAILGGNIKTALPAPVSYFQTVIPRYGAGVVLDGMSSFYAKGFNAQKFITDKSAFMRERVDTLSREAHERVRQAKGETAWNRVQGAGYWLMTFVEIWSVSGPTWMGVYRDALAKGRSEADAITDADRAVATTQGSGLEIDQSILQGGGEFQRALTFMWGYVSGYYGVVRNDIAKEQGYRKAWPIVKHLVIMNIAASLLEAFLRMKPGDDDDDPYLKSVQDVYWRNILGLIPGVSLAANRYGGAEAPAISTGQDLFKAWRAWERLAVDYAETGEIEGDVAYKAARQTAKSVGIALGVPGIVQIDKAINTLVVDDDPTLYEVLMSGPDKDN